MKNNKPMTGKVPKVGTGHRPRLSGAGSHKHKGERRLGNRSQQTARAVAG